MSKKIISILLALICVFGLASCFGGEKEEKPLPPVVTIGLPEKEELTTSYEDGDFVINIYETYSEIVSYKGKDTEVTVPEAFMGLAVKLIGEYAFFENGTVTKVTLPDSVIVIGKSAFECCTALKEIILGNSVEVISQAAFRDSALEKIDLPDSVAEINRYAFYRTRLTEVKLPSSISSVEKYVFYGCERLTKIEFCRRLERISEYAFASCTSLAEIVIPNGIEMLGDYSFSSCTSLEKIFIPKNTMIGENVFHGSNKLTVYSPSGSKAEAAAKRYGFSFKKCASAGKMP